MRRFRCVEVPLESAAATSSEATARSLLETVEEFDADIENNRGFIPNDGERYR